MKYRPTQDILTDRAMGGLILFQPEGTIYYYFFFEVTIEYINNLKKNLTII